MTSSSCPRMAANSDIQIVYQSKSILTLIASKLCDDSLLLLLCPESSEIFISLLQIPQIPREPFLRGRTVDLWLLFGTPVVASAL